MEEWKTEQKKKDKEASYLLMASEYSWFSSHGEQAVSPVWISSLSYAVWYVQTF